MMKSKTAKSFNVGDFVFAKVKGYVAWPAQITNYGRTKYNVYFYGTGQTANVNADDIYKYEDNKNKFITDKNMKKRRFKEAVDEIENDLYEEQSPPIFYEPQGPARREQKQVSPIEICGEKPLNQFRPTHNIEKDFLMVCMPIGKFFGIRIDYNKPVSFDSAAAEEYWMEKARKEAEELKLKLELGLVDPKSMPERIIRDPLQHEIPKKERERFQKELDEKQKAFVMEHDFVYLSHELRQCLGLRCANVSRCINLLTRMQEIEFNKLLLIKNKEYVIIIRRLRKYVGNVKSWKMDAADETEFNEKAQVIRELSTSIYDGFRALFNADTEEIFWKEFCDKVDIYSKFERGTEDILCEYLTEHDFDNMFRVMQNGMQGDEDVQDAQAMYTDDTQDGETTSVSCDTESDLL